MHALKRRPRLTFNYLLLMLLLATGPSWANHNDDECHANQPGCTPDGDFKFPFTPPAKTIEWALQKRANLWVDAWRPYGDIYKPQWAVETYDPRYVHPKQFIGEFFDQCQNAIDWDYFVNAITSLQSQTSRYQWSVDGVVKVADGDCYWQDLVLGGEGIHDVKLEVFKRGIATPYVTRTEDVRVRDLLVVLLGDSAASGEGAPEEYRAWNGGEWGKWIDRRCHRSTRAAVPLAVKALESDPHSSVTFLNFACSGATIKHSEPGEGVGILAPYAGVEPIEFEYETGTDYWLPSQVDQLAYAIETGYPISYKRKIDMLFTTGGINDVRFAKLAMACLLLENCQNETTPFFDAEANQVKIVYDDLAADIPGAYVDLKLALEDQDIEVGEVFVMQYPGAFENDDGSQCTSMLADVLPWESVFRLVTDPLIAPNLPLLIAASPILEAALGANPTSILLTALTGNLEWTSDEIDWMVDHAMPELDQAVRDGADDAGFTFIDGIRQAFAKHGYCANDNWIQTAAQASYDQGPWNFLSKPLNLPPIFNPFNDLGLGINAGTKGLMHPGLKGYEAWSKVLLPFMYELWNQAPIAKADFYEVDATTNPVFSTGIGPGVLFNDFDPDDEVVRAILVSGPSKGSAKLLQDGYLEYTPNVGYTGYDSLYYKLSDGGQVSQKVKVTFSVSGNRRAPPPKWKWTIPAGETTPEVQIGGKAEFYVCNNCGDMMLRVVTQRDPGYGKITFERGIDRWLLSYVQDGRFPPELPYLDVVKIEIGRNVIGGFQREGLVDVPVRIVGLVPPPPPTWSWIFRSPETVNQLAETRFDLCDNCGDLEVRTTVDPQLGTVLVSLDVERKRWVATYKHTVASGVIGDGFGVEIGKLTGDQFTQLGTSRVTLNIAVQ